MDEDIAPSLFRMSMAVSGGGSDFRHVRSTSSISLLLIDLRLNSMMLPFLRVVMVTGI